LPDTGERFFSEYLTTINPLKQQCDEFDLCLCEECKVTQQSEKTPQQQTSPTPVANNNTTTTTTPTEETMIGQDDTMPAPPKIIHTASTGNDVSEITRQSSSQSTACYATAAPLPSSNECQHLHYHHGAPVGGAAMYPTTPMMFPLIFPYPWMIPAQPAACYQPVPTPYCCDRHRSWYQQQNRMGRPPHDMDCHRRDGRERGKEKRSKKTKDRFTL